MSGEGGVEYLGILLTTYERTNLALRTIAGVREHLLADEIRCWYVADDGSAQDHFSAVWNALGGEYLAAAHTSRIGVGDGMNSGIAKLLEVTDFILTLEDDWELSRDFDIRDYIRLLRDHDDVGMIRLGHLPTGLDLHSVAYDGRIFLDVRPTQFYAYSGNPNLRHRRFFEAYGPYPSGYPPGENEVAYDWHVRRLLQTGPKIIWPVALGENGVFGHIGQRKAVPDPEPEEVA